MTKICICGRGSLAHVVHVYNNLSEGGECLHTQSLTLDTEFMQLLDVLPVTKGAISSLPVNVHLEQNLSILWN